MIHEKIRKLRHEHQLTQEQMAEALHISQNTYSLLENGKTKIDEQRLHQLAVIFKIPVYELLKNGKPLNVSEQLENEYVNNMQTLYKENKDLIVTLKEQLQFKDKQIDQLMVLLKQKFI